MKKHWYRVNTVIYVKRERIVKWKKSIEKAYFISDLPVEKWADFFGRYIRNHWIIENSLHYVKDVTRNEDKSRIRTGYQAQNISILKNVALNILREQWYENIAQAIRLIAHDIGLMYKLILA